MYYIYRTRRKRKRERVNEGECEQTTTLMPSHKKYSPKRWVLLVPTRGTTGLGSSLQDTKRKQRTTLDWCGMLSCGIIIYRKTILG